MSTGWTSVRVFDNGDEHAWQKLREMAMVGNLRKLGVWAFVVFGIISSSDYYRQQLKNSTGRRIGWKPMSLFNLIFFVHSFHPRLFTYPHHSSLTLAFSRHNKSHHYPRITHQGRQCNNFPAAAAAPAAGTASSSPVLSNPKSPKTSSTSARSLESAIAVAPANPSCAPSNCQRLATLQSSRRGDARNTESK